MDRFVPAQALPPSPPASLTALARQVRRRERSPVELVEASLAAIAERDPVVNAFTAVDAERALDQARVLATRLARGYAAGPLAGVPLAVKDLEDVAGLRTTRGDPALAGAPPARRDSLQVERLRAAGAIVVGKTNTPAYGHRAETDNPLFGPTRNPHAPGRTAGGSSGGAAAALAAGMVPLATGSDGGGSIRIPASCCGLAGFKPTTGVIPEAGEAGPGWLHLSTRGPMARTFPEVAMALDVVAGFAHGDLLALPHPGSFSAATVAGLGGRFGALRVAWSPTLGYGTPTAPVLGACEAAVATLGELGAMVEEVGEVLPEDPVEPWLTIVSVASARQIRDLRLPGGPEGAAERLGPSFAWLLRRGAAVSGLDYLDALDACHRVAKRLAILWERYDLVASPVTADLAPPIEGGSELGPGWVQFTYPFNLTGCPAASVPAGFATVGGETVPVGLQLAAPRLGDLRLLSVAAALESALGAGTRRRPPA